MTTWIHYQEREGLESWWESVKWLPNFMKQNVEFAAVQGSCTIIGAAIAYFQVARQSRKAASNLNGEQRPTAS